MSSGTIRFLALGATASVIACLAALAQPGSTAPGATGAVLRVRDVADPQTFDWNLAHTHMETPIVMNIMEGLMMFDHEMRVRPQLAESWTVSPDLKNYTFKIRSGIKWTDGKPLTANDFVYSWKRLLDPLTAAPYAYMLFDIEGAEDFNARKGDFSKVGIKAVDDHTLTVKLKKPVTYFIQMLTFWVAFPLRQDVVEVNGAGWASPGKIVTLGPFKLDSYQIGSEIVLKRNETYWGKRPFLDAVDFKIVNEDTTALNLFKAGQIDFLRPVNFLELGALASSPSFHSEPYYRTCFININTTKYPFDLPKMRQAMAMAIDTSNIAKVLHRIVKPAYSLVPDELLPAGARTAIPFNPEGAKKLFAEVGIDPVTAPKIEFFTYASDENAMLAQYVQDQLKKNLGLRVEIQMPEFKMFRTQLELKTGALYHRCWGADYADPDSFFGIFLGAAGNNRTGWKSDEYDDLVKRAASTPNGTARTKLYLQALDILLKKEAPLVPLHFDSLTYLLNPKIKNFEVNPLNYVYFKDVTF
jgi:oligopeptide transport system substrate-binding protein